MAQFTHGPWVRDRASGIGCDVRAESGRKVALCFGLTNKLYGRKYREECDANAVLISAAPDLFEALEELVVVYSSDDGHGEIALIEKARAAIRKAIGQS